MKTLGLTGSIGMGKSTVAAMFRAQGVPVFDADAEVHRLQGPGSPLLAAIEALHPGTTSIEKGVDRAALRQAVWGNDAALARLEALIYPALHLVRQRFLRRHRARPLVVLDIPLLFEKGGWRKVDAIAVVSAPAWIQRRRVMARPGMTAARLAHILSLQTPDREKRRRADFVIETGRIKNVTRAQVLRVTACFVRR